ncbi:GGDEF domain-containing protein [Actinoplanes sp. NBRC 101535]|uniref:GGDEF domain-containing protein n=1 Tax=Actinoplanes sp. NBRC 101535 TaxID=3032196 RepID=UPI0024A55309|nr:GGDEF domain-containing protein [Actinoplanes sp. NBRC 101535]GLY04497.1 hypothetical protein Acsp01_48760 [Actinoplanes sp. NBRC 101535]
MTRTHVEQELEEVVRLRAELAESRVTSVRALARATRLARLISALGQLVDVDDVYDRAVSEVADLFGADVAIVLTPDDESRRVRLAAQWGIAARHLPPGTCDPPEHPARLTAENPVTAGPAGDFTIPDWLAPSGPRHVAWGLLTVRDEHLGHLLLVRRADTPFDAAEVQELAAVVSRISLAADNGLLYHRTQEQLRRSRLLHRLTADLARLLDVDEVVRRVIKTLIEYVPVASAAVYLTGGRPVPEKLPEGTERLALGHDDTEVGTLLVTGAPAPDSDARLFLDHLVDVSALVLEKALFLERMRTQAETDALTGLPNRALFRQRLATAVARCEPRGAPLTVMFVDLDGFKAVNDTHGHDAGDQLLIAVAGRLAEASGLTALCARLGGDEFVVLWEGGVPAGVLDRIQRALDEPFTVETPDGPVTVTAGGSLGLGTAASSGYDAEAVLREADTGMYAAKQHRRARPATGAGFRA